MKNGELTEMVGAFSNELEAKLVQGALKQAGIASAVFRFSRYRAMSGGGYTLKTAPVDKVAAEKIISVNNRPIDMDEYVDENDRSYRRCPVCASVNIKAEAYTSGQILAGVATLGIALYFVRRPWHCAKCGHEWVG